jgi:hypothetical protein
MFRSVRDLRATRVAFAGELTGSHDFEGSRTEYRHLAPRLPWRNRFD